MSRNLDNSHSCKKITRATLFAVCLVLLSIGAVAQEVVSLQVKVFDQNLKPLKEIELAFNDLDFFSTNSRGTAITELAASEIPIRNVRVKDEKLEAASWNLSKGIVEVIIRPKNYVIFPIVVRSSAGEKLAAVPVTFAGAATQTVTTNEEGRVEFRVGLTERSPSAEQFTIANFKVVQLSQSGNEHVLLAERIRVQQPVTGSEATPTVRPPQNFDPAIVDSIHSLSSFYRVFSKMPVASFDEAQRRLIDAKFRQLLAAKDDSLTRAQNMYVEKISDSSMIAQDIKNLLMQATVEGNTLAKNRADFENRIELISRKLDRGVLNLSQEDRATLLEDIDQLEKLLTENESQFYQNHNDYREIIAALKETYFDIQTLEERLSLAEQQKEEERIAFRRKMWGIGGVVVLFGLLIILLIYFSSRLRQRTKSLQKANSEIEEINANLEGMVKRRTRLLQEANKELDTFLYRASHDLRAPVRSIIGLCQIIEFISQKEMVERVEKATHTMDRVLNKLIDISEIAQEATNLSDVKPLEVITKVRNHQLVMTHGVSVFRNNMPIMINPKPVQFDVNCPEDLTVRTSASLLEIIMNNLIENAIFFGGLKTTGSNARVEVSVVGGEDFTKITVFDNGVGIADQVKPGLFKMFFTGNEASKGNGLGLYAVSKCVSALHGTVSVESEEGEFTKVIVTLPVVRDHYY